MRGFAMTAMVVVAVAGLSACNRGAANNSATKNTTANTAAAAPAPAPAPAPAAPAAAAGMDDATFRTTFASQCTQQVAANPQTPAGIDAGEICGCVVEDSFTGKTGLYAYASSAEGQQAIAKATEQCVIAAAGGADGEAE